MSPTRELLGHVGDVDNTKVLTDVATATCASRQSTSPLNEMFLVRMGAQATYMAYLFD